MIVVGFVLFCLLMGEIMFGGGWTGIERVEKHSSSWPNSSAESKKFTSSSSEAKKFPPGSLDEGLSLHKEGKYFEAISVFESIILNEPDRGAAYWNLALCYDHIENNTKAVMHYEKCLTLFKHQDLHKKLGKVYFALEDFQNAKFHLQKSAHGDDVFMLLGICHLSCDDLNSAERILGQISDGGSQYHMQLSKFIVDYKYEQARLESEQKQAKSELFEYYNILELRIGASKSDIRLAYREMCKVWHPDRFCHDPQLQLRAEKKMKDINKAYGVLCKL